MLEFGILDVEERMKRYRRYVYETGSLDSADRGTDPEECSPLSQVNSTGQAWVIDKDIVEHERKKNYEIKRIDRFRYRTRYFADSGIIGTKEYVSMNYQKFKDLFMSKRQKIPKPVSCLDGVYSLKRLAER